LLLVTLARATPPTGLLHTLTLILGTAVRSTCNPRVWLRMRICCRLIVVTVVVAALACGGTTEPLAACSGAVTVTVTGGTTPTIGWTPECGADFLMVAEPLPPSVGFAVEPRWVIGADARLIEPSVRYGRTPNGVQELLVAHQLEVGRTYRASVRNGPTFLGAATFTP
jgi:hypothetical protein